jgi:hypothetical protein
VKENEIPRHPDRELNLIPSDKGTAFAQWLRCYATNRKVAGSNSAGVAGIFH